MRDSVTSKNQGVERLRLLKNLRFVLVSGISFFIFNPIAYGISPNSKGPVLVQKVAAPLATLGSVMSAPSPAPTTTSNSIPTPTGSPVNNMTSSCSISDGSIMCMGSNNISYSGCTATCTGQTPVCQSASCSSTGTGGTCYEPPSCSCL